MEITSLYFISLSIAAILVYYLISPRLRIPFLALLSAGFIATYSINLLGYVLFYTLLNYALGIFLPQSKNKKLLFIFGIIFNLSQLVLLKYVSFTLNPLLEVFNVAWDFEFISRIIVPVGVSFFTLQGIGYLINVNLGWEKPETDFIQFLVYISFFPRFLSGPIDRSNHFLPQLKEAKRFDQRNIIGGLRLILFGLFKKIAIANQLAPIVSGAYANIESPDQYTLWIVLLLQPIYLYFDFSGYTDIAFGIARGFGIELRPNFNRPFLAENMTNFWKRFHISLSSWFHDYIFMRIIFRYRKWGQKASTIGLFLTWTLFGIWHGAGWTFMLLGFLQGLAIYYEFSTKRWRARVFGIMPLNMRLYLSRFFTYLFYGTSLVFFFAPDMNSVRLFFTKLFKTNGIILGGVNKELFILVMFFVVILMILEILKNDFRKIFERIENFWFGPRPLNRIMRWGLYLIVLTVVMVFNNDVQQFIYFQF